MPLIDPALKTLHQRCLEFLNARQPRQAIPLLREVLVLAPDEIDVWDHLSAALTMDGQYEQAEQAFRKCFELGCTYPETMCNAARNAQLWSKPQLQYEHARRLLSLEGELRWEGLRHCAEALSKGGRHLDAVAACQQLLLERPADFAARQAMVRVLLDCGQPEMAMALCEELLEQQPDHRPLRLSLIEATIVSGEMEAGLRNAEILLESDADNLDAMSALGFHYQFLTNMSVAERRAHAQRFGSALSRIAEPFTAWPNSLDGERVLRVGIVSGDLRHHPVAFFMLSLLEALHNRSLQFFVYDVMEKHDAITAKIRPLTTGWHNVKGMSDRNVVELIRNDSIDILLEVQGYMAGNRLSVIARKPAPVQVSWMGFQGTTGTPGVDYVLVDRYCVPPGAEDEFIEKVWRLPEHTLCFTVPEVECPEVAPPVVANGFITFGCLNNPHKINDQVLALWAQIMVRVPGSRLLFKGGKLNFPSYRERFITRLQAHGIDMHRVTLEGPEQRSRFLQTYNRVDIALDPFPCSGATTTCEALWAGVPVLALRGDRMVWRMAESLLVAVGLTDWLASTPDEFVEIAVRKAGDIQALVTLRKKQRTQVLQSPLIDAPRFAAQFEHTLRDIWREYVAKQQIDRTSSPAGRLLP